MHTELSMSSRGMENNYLLGLPKGTEWEGMLLPGLHPKQPPVVRKGRVVASTEPSCRGTGPRVRNVGNKV